MWLILNIWLTLRDNVQPMLALASSTVHTMCGLFLTSRLQQTFSLLRRLVHLHQEQARSQSNLQQHSLE